MKDKHEYSVKFEYDAYTDGVGIGGKTRHEIKCKSLKKAEQLTKILKAACAVHQSYNFDSHLHEWGRKFLENNAMPGMLGSPKWVWIKRSTIIK